jgi:hypothetical protein
MCSEYYNSLEVVCEGGYMHQYGLLNWTVASDTPDLVYYQSYTHEVQRGEVVFLAQSCQKCHLSSNKIIPVFGRCLLPSVRRRPLAQNKLVNWILGTT